jgi:RimJ/RimL family protein N-acetyltransferase
VSARWPVLDIRVRVGDLDLQPVTDADHDELARLLPPDLELDPSATRFPGLDEATSRATVMQQSYWRYYGTWTPEAWRLNFVVRTHGRLLGMQELEGNDFASLRTVDTSSWLLPEARGLGHGKAMRRAVLALAFGPLGAQVAITEAWHDNHASLGVSRALGYQPNGEALHRRDDGVDTMVHLRLTRADWLAGDGPADVAMSGYEAALPFFGA